MRVRTATLRDYEAMCALFDALDEFHRQARPDLFQPFGKPVRTREQVARWLSEAGSTILVAESEEGVVGLAVLLTRPPPGFAGSVPRRVIELDNIVVRVDQRGRKIGRCSRPVWIGCATARPRTSRSRCMPSTRTRAASTKASASSLRSLVA